MDKLQKQVGTEVRRARLARGLTQAQLAESIGRSTDLVSRIERGQAAPSFDTLESLCASLQVSATALFGSSFASDPPDPVRAALEQAISGMDKDELAWVLDLLRVSRARPTRR